MSIKTDCILHDWMAGGYHSTIRIGKPIAQPRKEAVRLAPSTMAWHITAAAFWQAILDKRLSVDYTGPCSGLGAVAQLGARINRTDEVRGSNPLSSTSHWQSSGVARGCSAAGSAPQWH